MFENYNKKKQTKKQNKKIWNKNSKILKKWRIKLNENKISNKNCKKY